jgi:hypothetical protein
MLQAYEPPYTAVDGVDMTLGEAMLDVYTQNTIVLDALAFRGPDVISSSAGKDTSTPNAYTGLATEVIWRGAFLMASGMTTLTIEGWAQKGASESFQLFVNGAGISTTAVPNGTTFTLTWTIAGLSAGDVGDVIIQISGARTAPQALAAKYVIYDAYVSPVSVASTWPGVPTFSGTYSAALLNQLGNCQIYLAQRLNALPHMGYVGQYYVHGSSVTADVYPLWWGAVERANGANILNIRIVPMLPAAGNTAEYYRVKVNGSIVSTGATMTAGQARDDYLAIDLSSFTAGTRLETVIETVITTGAPLGPSGDRNTRYHLWTVRMSNAAAAVMAAPYDFTADESLASTSVDTKLNALSAALLAAYTRVNGNPRIFNRVPLMRHIYGRDSGQYSVYAPANTYVQRFVRAGQRLTVRGKGVKVGWGAYSTKAEKTVTTAYAVDFAHSQQLTEGDQYQTKTIYLDTLEGLRRGQAYIVGGEDLIYAHESLL